MRFINIEEGSVLVEMFNFEARHFADAFSLAASAVSGGGGFPAHLENRDDLFTLYRSIGSAFELAEIVADDHHFNLGKHQAQQMRRDGQIMVRDGLRYVESAEKAGNEPDLSNAHEIAIHLQTMIAPLEARYGKEFALDAMEAAMGVAVKHLGVEVPPREQPRPTDQQSGEVKDAPLETPASDLRNVDLQRLYDNVTAVFGEEATAELFAKSWKE